MAIATLPLVAVAEVPATSQPRDIEVGAGAFFNAGGSFIAEPRDKSVVDGSNALLPYNGFAGFSPGGGLGVDVRWKGVVGLEIDMIRSNDASQTEMYDYDIYIEQSSFHVPILVKGILPAGLVRPNLLAGVTLVMPGEATVDSSPPIPGVTLAAHADDYMLWTVGLGFEFALPFENADIRLPLSFRASFNTSTPESARELAAFEASGAGVLTQVDYVSEYQYQAAVTLGLFYHFL